MNETKTEITKITAETDSSRSLAHLSAVIEALIFVSEEPVPVQTIAAVLEEEKDLVQSIVENLAAEYNLRENCGLMLREIAGGWQIVTRPEFHEEIRRYLRTRPAAKLSLAALETLAVIAYK